MKLITKCRARGLFVQHVILLYMISFPVMHALGCPIQLKGDYMGSHIRRKQFVGYKYESLSPHRKTLIECSNI